MQVEGESSDTIGLRLVVRERDELKQAVSGFEVELVEIQTEAKALAEDRDNFKLLYEQVVYIYSSVLHDKAWYCLAAGPGRARGNAFSLPYLWPGPGLGIVLLLYMVD